jgi:chaperonin cofactor prefoldin
MHFLAVCLVVAAVDYTSIITSLNSQVSSKDSQIQTLTSQKNQLQTWLNCNVTSLNSQIGSLNSTVTTLQSQVMVLKAIINMSKSKNLKTLVFHVEATYTGHQIPDVNYTYNQILALNNNTHNVLLNPEYRGNYNWTETLEWLTANFGGQHGIPIMLDVFGGLT